MAVFRQNKWEVEADQTGSGIGGELLLLTPEAVGLSDW